MKGQYSVYRIIHQGEVKYVGITNNFKRRIYQHRSKYNSALPPDVSKNSVIFELVMDGLSKDKAIETEEKLIEKYNTINLGWNKNGSGGKKYRTLRKLDYDSNWQKLNRDAYREYQREYHRKWVEANRAKVNEYQREYQHKRYLKRKETL